MSHRSQRMIINRRQLAVMLAGAVAAVRPAFAQPLRKISFQQSWLSGVQYSGLYLAQADGLFGAKGIDVEFMPGGPNVDGTLNVVTGKAMLGDRPTDILITARGKGMPIKVIASMYQRSPMSVMSLRNKPIHSLKDMMGKTVAVSGGTRPIFQTLMKNAGLDPTSVNWVPVSPDPGALAAGQIDGLTGLDTNQGSVLRSRGLAIDALLLSDVGYHIYTGAIFTTEEFLKSNRAALVGFLQAAVAGHRAVLANPARAAAITIEKFAAPGMSLDAAKLEAVASLPYITDGGAMTERLLWVDPAKIEAAIKVHVDNGAIAKGYAASELIDNSLIAEAYKST
jgi:ABC-type nitrate/sulfonate/bicarbonate transport system substrate-binding protein